MQLDEFAAKLGMSEQALRAAMQLRFLDAEAPEINWVFPVATTGEVNDAACVLEWVVDGGRLPDIGGFGRFRFSVLERVGDWRETTTTGRATLRDGEVTVHDEDGFETFCEVVRLMERVQWTERVQ